MKIYQANIVKNLNAYYGSLLLDYASFDSIKDHLGALAHRLHIGILQKEAVVFSEINNYHADYLSQSMEQILAANFALRDCQKTIANEYGFVNWAQVLRQVRNTGFYISESLLYNTFWIFFFPLGLVIIRFQIIFQNKSIGQQLIRAIGVAICCGAIHMIFFTSFLLYH